VVKEPVAIVEFIKEVHEEITSTLKPGQELIIACDENVDVVNTDVRILRNILFNLISNASKYSDPGKRIFISVKQQEGDDVSFVIRDEGIGIPTEDQKHMFERFFRASNAGNVQGTGLGLNIVKRYVDLLGGNISFTSEFGKGSVFTVWIPVQ
jgi:signal transduction histidine kinase